MRFNVFGNAGAGIDETISIDKSAVAKGSGSSVGPCWLTPERLLYRDQHDALAVYVKTTGAYELVDPRGANDFRANGGVFAAYLDRPSPIVYGPNFTIAGASLADVGPDGAIAYCPRQQDGVPIVVRDGVEEWTLTTEPARVVQLLGGRRAIWLDGAGTIRAVGLPQPVQVGPANDPRAAELNGVLYLQYWVMPDGPLVLHPWHTTLGKALHSAPDAFKADLAGVSGRLLSGWSSGQGERPEQVFTTSTDPAELTNDLQPNESIPAIGRRMWVSWFVGSPQASGGWYTDVPWQRTPGNSRITVGEPNLWQDAQDRVIGIFVEGRPSDSNSDDIDRAIDAAARFYKISVMGYWPRRAQSVRVPVGAKWIGVEVYWKLGESLAQLEAAADSAIEACRILDLPVVLIPQAFTSNDSLQKDLRPIVGLTAKLARKHANVVGLAPFNGTGRDTGLLSLHGHPEVEGLWRSLLAGVPGPPEIDSAPAPPVAPTAMIASYDASADVDQPVHANAIVSGDVTRLVWRYRLLGTISWVAAGSDTGLSFTYRFHVPGSYEISLRVEGPAGRAETTRQCLVQITSAPIVSPFPLIYPYRIGGSMQTERGGLRGARGKFVRLDSTKPGKGLFEGYPVLVDAEDATGDAEWELSQPDGRFTLTHVKTGAILGMDATQFSADLTKQYYTRPPDKRGGYESPQVGRLPSGTVIAFVEYDSDEHGNPAHFLAAPLVWEKAS
jgi:hypothetical protein